MDFLNSIVAFLSPLVDEVNGFLYRLAGSKNGVGILIAILGCVAILVVFVIAAFVRLGSKTRKFTKKVKLATAGITAIGIVDETNVAEFYDKIKSLPTSIVNGWGNFMGQQTGYPSDYVLEKDLVADQEVFPKHKPGIPTFKFLRALVVFVCMLLAGMACRDVLDTITEATAVPKVVTAVLCILGAVALPLILSVVLAGIIKLANKRASKKAIQDFREFQTLLDNVVAIFKEPVDEFVSENIEEINSAIEAIIAEKMDKKEIITISTVPSVSANLEEAEPVIVNEPLAAVANSVSIEVAKPALLTKEEEKRYLEQLITIVDAAVKDPNVAPSDLEKVALLIADSKDSGFKDPRDQQILEECLILLADVYFK